MKIYDDLKLVDEASDDAKDAAGFTGEFRRGTQQLKYISKRSFISFFKLYPKKLAELFHLVRGIDDDRNGYITQTEMDDILKLILGPDKLVGAEKV